MNESTTVVRRQRRGRLVRGARRRRGAAALLLLLTAACATHLPVVAPAPTDTTRSLAPALGTLLRSQRAVERGEYDDADRMLAEFAVSHPGTPEGAESDFFRALFRADPANGGTTLRDQLAAFDAYLGGGAALPRYAEAVVLRRLVEVADSSRVAVIAVRKLSEVREHAKDAEIQRLSDELEKTVAELERVKRRLAKP